MDETKLTQAQMIKVVDRLPSILAQARDNDLSDRKKSLAKFGQSPRSESPAQRARSTDRVAQFFASEQRKQLKNLFLDDSNFGYDHDQEGLV